MFMQKTVICQMRNQKVEVELTSTDCKILICLLLLLNVCLSCPGVNTQVNT